MDRNDFIVPNISYSQLRTFLTNTWEWQNNRLLGIYDNKIWVSGAVWTVLHTFVEQYLKFWWVENAIDKAYSTIYNSSDWQTYIVALSEIENLKNEIENSKGNFERIENIKSSFDIWVKNLFWTKVVDFWKTWSNEKIIKDVKAWVEAFLSETVDYWKVLEVEFSMETEAFEKLNWKTLVKSPIPFKAIADEICRTTSTKTIMVDWAPEILDPGALFLEDTKFKSSHSDMNSEDPKYIFQAFFNYYCVLNHFWEAPKYMIFREIKTSKNKDWSSQHQTITIPFFGKTFEEYKIYFWRYILESFERIKFIQERDFLFNIFDIYNGTQEWEKQKAYYLDVEVWQLKSRIAQTSKNRFSQNMPVMGDRDPLLKNSKNIWKDVEVEDLFSIENKIKNAFRNFGVLVNFEKKVEWYSFDQYLFSTARGITMWKVKMHLPEIIQALEVEKWIRIEAPVLGTKFIWVEIPRIERKFAELKEVPKSKKPIIPVWKTVDWKTIEIDLSDSGTPHLIVAWKTWSWKSEFLKSAVFSLAEKWEIILLDPKKVGLLKVSKYANQYLSDHEEIDLMFELLLLEMDNRYKEFGKLWVENIYEEKVKWKFEEKFVFVDEFADLVNAQKQIPKYDKFWQITGYNIVNLWAQILNKVGRLVALWRACWIHLIIATQRPSVKVIPWDIKANIATRICFALATEVDSKVVLDESWAENLLGKWDMIFSNEGEKKRLQWFYI